jgi:sugar/nucleoside kinase (ribokinase family)
LKPEVVGIGEALVDFVGMTPVSYGEVSAFQKCFGGAPMNTLIGVSRLDSRAGAITAVGDDPFGQFLITELEENGVDTSRVKVKRGMRTTISFVANEPKTGERTFLFYREPWVQGTADSALSPEDLDFDYISHARILHVSGFALSHNPSRRAVLSAAKYANKVGVTVSFDPTLRTDVWSSVRTLRSVYRQLLKLSDVATFSREEATFLFRTHNMANAAKEALKHGVKMVGIKLGSDGALLDTKEGTTVQLPGFQVNAVDTTGAGDGWNAGLLVGLLKGWDLQTCVTVANAVGALVVTKLGAITALPDKNELNTFLKEQAIDINL